MRKLLFALLLATATQTASAVPIMTGGRPVNPAYNSQYNVGYRHGKHDAYNNVARTVVFLGVATIAGIIIYQAGKESRWTTNEKGVVYRF